MSDLKSINILLLGETGVGKSTWINGLVNYLTHKTLVEAEKSDEDIGLIASQFTHTDNNFEETTITYGQDKNEVQVKGQSATQMPRTYCFDTSILQIRIIDTPGIGDVRGIEKDKENLQYIMTHIAEYDFLHGIVILMQPNNSRMTPSFVFCIKELLTHLHRDACKNIVICFTNARGTFYRPGDSIQSLKAVLEANKEIQITLDHDTVYCVDNESFRFLMALKNGIQFTEQERGVFAASWEKAVDEMLRLITHIASLEPHPIKNTVSLNEVRRLIFTLSRPIAELVKTIEDNIKVVEDKQKEKHSETMSIEELKKKLHVPVIDLEPEELGYPRTVCTAPSCASVVQVGNGNKYEYKKICHEKCGIRTGKDVIGNAELQYCWAMDTFLPGKKCRICGCDWFKHMHITYQTKQVTKHVVDENIQKLIDDKNTAVEAIQQFENWLIARKREYENERKEFVKVSAKCAYFLRRNAITPVNDAMASYMDYIIEMEKRKIAQGGNRTTLDNLIQMKATYIEEIRIIEEAMSSADNDADQLDAESIRRLIDGLYELKHFGPQLKDLMSAADGAHCKASLRSEKSVVVKNENIASRLHLSVGFGGRGLDQESRVGLYRVAANAFGFVRFVSGLGRAFSNKK